MTSEEKAPRDNTGCSECDALGNWCVKCWEYPNTPALIAAGAYLARQPHTASCWVTVSGANCDCKNPRPLADLLLSWSAGAEAEVAELRAGIEWLERGGEPAIVTLWASARLERARAAREKAEKA